MKRIRILLADDHTLFRRGIAGFLATQADFEIVGEAANGQQALELARQLSPDIVLMDLEMPQVDGLEATRRIKAEMPDVRVVVLTATDTGNSLFEAVKGGAQGYLLKNIDPETLYANLRGVMRGEASLSRSMATRLLTEFTRQAAPQPKMVDLTPREKEVLEGVAHGRSNKEIASALGITENTVKNHLKNILEKLHAENRVQAATLALRLGLVTPRST